MKAAVICLYPREAAPVFTSGLICGLKENKIDTYVILAEDISKFGDMGSIIDSEHSYYCNYKFDKKNPISVLNDLSSIKKKIGRIHFDYVFLTFPSKKDWVICKILKKSNICMFLHDVIPHSSTDPKHTKKKKRLIKRSDKIIVLTKSFKTIASREFNKSLSDIIDIRIPLFTYPKKKDVSHKYDSSLNLNFLFFGRIDGYKGLEYLAEAVDILNQKGRKFTVTIAGGGDFSRYIKLYEKFENVNIINRYISDDEIEELFNRDNCIAILPYIDATQSGVIPMAMYYHIPIIATDVGGLKEQLFDGKVGILCEAADSKSLANAMDKYLTEPEMYNKQVLLSDSFIKELTWNNIVHELLKKLESS